MRPSGNAARAAALACAAIMGGCAQTGAARSQGPLALAAPVAMSGDPAVEGRDGMEPGEMPEAAIDVAPAPRDIFDTRGTHGTYRSPFVIAKGDAGLGRLPEDQAIPEKGPFNR